jgi:SAM-dependent methyltransferase
MSGAASFTTVTELPGSRASREQLDMARTRYEIAAQLGAGRDVLEVACGCGIGLAYIARRARSVVGGDFDPEIVAIAQREAAGRYEVRQMDAQALPYPAGSFDTVIMLEALYYIPDAARFFAEARRVLRPGGCLFVCSANREWDGFNPSPFSVRYYSLTELGQMLRAVGLDPELRVGFPVETRGRRAAFLHALRRLAVRAGLIPKTMGGKEWLKRLVYGKLAPMPRELTEETGQVRETIVYPSGQPVTGYRVLYAIGRLPADGRQDEQERLTEEQRQ